MVELAEVAKEKGIRLGFVFPDVKTEEVKNKLESLSAKVYIIRENWTSFRLVNKLLKITLKEAPQILDFHFCYSINFVFLFLILKLLRKKIIYHYHGEIKPVEELKFFNRHFSKLRLFSFFVDKIICVSEANKRFLEALNVSKRKICVVYNGIKIENFDNFTVDKDFKEEVGFNDGEVIITSIGSLISRKGINVLIESAKYVLEEFPQARFVIVGRGNKEKYQKLARDLEIENKIVFTGLIKEYPYYILKATDLYVSASFSESFGLSIAEAQALGIPVVATRVGGVPEVVNNGKTGLLVPAGDAKALAKAIITLLKDKELRNNMGAKGRMWIRERFNLSEKVEELINVCIR